MEEKATWDELQGMDKRLAGGKYIHSHGAQSPDTSHTFWAQQPKLSSLANFLRLNPSWSKENYVFAFFMSQDQNICFVSILGRGKMGERNGGS